MGHFAEYAIAQPTMEQVFMKAVTKLEGDGAGGGAHAELGQSLDDPLLGSKVTEADSIALDALNEKFSFEEDTCCCLSHFAHHTLCRSACGCWFFIYVFVIFMHIGSWYLLLIG